MPAIRLVPQFVAGLLVVFNNACSLPAEIILDDFGAIHDAKDFSPKSPAKLWHAPEDYHPTEGMPKHRIGEASSYEVADHRQLDQWLLERIATIHPEDFGASLDAIGWLSMALLYDQYPDTQLEAAVIISSFAGHWADTMEVKLPRQQPQGDLVSALQALVQSYELVDSPYFLNASEAAYHALDSAKLADIHVSARIAHGIAMHLRADQRTPPGGKKILARFGLRVALQALTSGAQSSSKSLADACQARLDLIKQYLNLPS